MIYLVKVISTSFSDTAKRLVKFLRLGTKDVQNMHSASQYGFDSNPIKDMVAVFAETQSKGKSVIIGYLNKDQIAEVGESRVYATDSDGNLKYFLHFKNDGTAEFGGTGDFLVKYNALLARLTDLESEHNGLLARYNAHTHVGNMGAPTSTTSLTVSPSSLDFTTIKHEKIKTD